MQGVNSLVGSDMPMVDAETAATAQTAGADSPSPGRGFGGTVASFLGTGTNVVTDGSEWLVAVMVVLALLFLISLRVGGITSIIVEG